MSGRGCEKRALPMMGVRALSINRGGGGQGIKGSESLKAFHRTAVKRLSTTLTPLADQTDSKRSKKAR